MHIPIQGFFITGSDTNVGKTWVAREIIKQLNDKYASVKVRKPVESGCKKIDGEYLPADGNTLFEANHSCESLSLITPYRFHAALAPDRAARLENHTLTLEQLHQACLNQITADDILLVEGAGGFYSPICEDGLNADLARALGLKVIIVCEDRLGAINQALLTIAAVKQEGLKIQAVVLNQNKPPTGNDSNLDNFQDLSQRTDIPVFTCAYQSNINEQVI
jgi:dethiobiotin synthetase